MLLSLAAEEHLIGMTRDKASPAEDAVKSPLRLDSTDRRIIGELCVSSCQPFKKLAARLKISEQTLEYRVKRLLGCQAIRGYRAIIDYSKLGYYSITANYLLSSLSAEEEKYILDAILATNATSVFRCDGKWNLSVNFLAKDDSMVDNVHVLKRILSNRVISADLSIHSGTMIFPISLFLNSQAQYGSPRCIGGREKTVPVDEKDLMLLRALGENARMPIVKLAGLLSMPPRTVAYRKNRLKKSGVIVGCTVDVNPNLEGLHFYRVYVSLRAPDKKIVNSVVSYLAAQPQTVRVVKLLALYELFYDVGVCGGDDFRAFKAALEKKFGEAILQQEHMRIYYEPRFGYFFPLGKK